MIEKVIEYQNQSEINFEKTKNLNTIFNYIVPFILFISSTFIAALTFPFRYIYKKLFQNNSPSKILTIDESNIETILNKQEFILIDFWAEWCGPCIMMSSIIEKFASESKNIKVGKVNADFNKSIIEKYQIRGLPQFIFVKNGKEIKRFAGAMTKSDLIKFCNNQDK